MGTSVAFGHLSLLMLASDKLICKKSEYIIDALIPDQEVAMKRI